MNRRHRKKQQVDHLERLKQRWSSIDFKGIKLSLPDWNQARDNIVSFWNCLPKLHRRAVSVLTPLVIILVLWPGDKNDDSKVQTTPNQRVALDLNPTSLSEQSSTIPTKQSLTTKEWQEYTVKQGDTLAQVFRKNQFSMADLNALAKIEGSDKPLSRIKQGQLIRFKLTEEGALDILQVEKSGQSIMFFRLSDGGFGRSK
jgi:cell envelope opacity-associated protein A